MPPPNIALPKKKKKVNASLSKTDVVLRDLLNSGALDGLLAANGHDATSLRGGKQPAQSPPSLRPRLGLLRLPQHGWGTSDQLQGPMPHQKDRPRQHLEQAGCL